MGRFVGLLVFAVLSVAFAAPAQAEKIQNPIAVFAALDKVTGRISPLEIPMNETVQFGALKVTPRICDTRPPTEPPHTASFVEVDEIKLSGDIQRIFTGWMFAESPGLHAVEHPVFDVWLTSCKTSAPVAPGESAQNAEAAPAGEAGAAPPADAGAAPAEAAAAPEPPAPLPDRKPKKPPVAVARPAAPAAPPPSPPPAPGGFWNRF
jgi:hypothetical protein